MEKQKITDNTWPEGLHLTSDARTPRRQPRRLPRASRTAGAHALA